MTSLGKHYASFVEKALTPLIGAMVDRMDNATLWMQVNNAILMKTRLENEPAVRKAALDIELALFNQLGERFLIVLQDAVRFLSESLEDDDEKVEAAAKEVVKKIESLTGESIQEYLR